MMWMESNEKVTKNFFFFFNQQKVRKSKESYPKQQ